MAFVGWAEGGGGGGEGWEVGEGSSRGGGFGDRGGILASLEFQETPWVPTLDFAFSIQSYVYPSLRGPVHFRSQSDKYRCSGRRVQ